MDDAYKQALGQVLAEKRRMAGLNKQQLGLMVGVSRLTIRKIEQGKANPTVGILLRITNGLEVSLADMLVECERLLTGPDAENRPALPTPTIRHTESAPSIHYYLTSI